VTASVQTFVLRESGLEATTRSARPLKLAALGEPYPDRERANAPDKTLRERAIAADAASTMEMSLALLWRELTRGLCKVVDAFFTDERCYLVVAACAEAPFDAPAGRRLQILEAIMCGTGQKNIAIELGLAPSTIALNARLALASLGVDTKPSRVHPLLMLAAKASNDRDAAFLSRLALIADDHRALRVVAIPRPDRCLAGVLPTAELAVVRSLIEGVCYRDIAQLRGTSTRTIANQITSVFRRMRVSGRSELLLRLFFAEGLGRGPIPQPLSETFSPPSATVAAVNVRVDLGGDG
jgi:DNA-binding NarL/FixJ family response regulator